MNNSQKFVRFFCACAPGIAIGFWIAEKADFLGLVGAGVGVMISYLLVEWKEVFIAISKAWENTVSWKPNKQEWRCRGLAGLGLLSMLSSCIFFLLISLWIRSGFLPGYFSSESLKEISVVLIVVSAGVILCSFLWFFEEVGLVERNGWSIPLSRQARIEKYRRVIKNGHPLAVFVYWPIKGFIMAIAFMWRRFIPFCTDFGIFLKEIIFTIHSQKRVLCATTTFIAVVSGYMVDGSLVTFTIVGATIGGLYSISPWRKWVLFKTQPQLASA